MASTLWLLWKLFWNLLGPLTTIAILAALVRLAISMLLVRS
jgi:hypothetical protein